MDNIAAQVRSIVTDSLYRTDDIIDNNVPQGAVIAAGIMRTFGFHPQRLETHRLEVVQILAEMPKEFHKATGGGWSFLNLCNDRHGEQWGEHPDMDELCCLAIGLGLGKFVLPREVWSSLPGGVPYVVFDLEGQPCQPSESN